MEVLTNAASSRNPSSTDAVPSEKYNTDQVAVENAMTPYGDFASKQETRSSMLSSRTIEYLKFNSTPAPARLIPTMNLSTQEQAELLNIYKTEMALYFPFIVIPPNTSAETLARESPFLYKNIMMVASSSNPLRQIGK